jgi:DNA invertase Pin-like site-specific DNA recombinase
MNDRRRFRCAIYTRKSHEEGLDQTFNSLDAQREACEAYIHSQAGLGWELIEEQYDDGGISGGHMEREGLQTLLADIRAGKVDVVVVYKVDRLTRSIIDFGKLVEAFDTHDVSFVSVTQAFNTTNSMGRLTLNVLLSFAQFEREVTAERIRDKIASSKQKGMWMGGRVPFGYRAQNRELFIDPDEAQVVRLIFELYHEHRRIKFTKEALDRQGILSRTRTSRSSGRVTGGLPFSKGNIASILANPVYAGRIKHKDKVYAGNHEAIIAETMWEEVQHLRNTQAASKTKRPRPKCSGPALFAGAMFDADGNRLICERATKKGKHYYYYTSSRNKLKDTDPKASIIMTTGKPTGKPIRMPVAKTDPIIEAMIADFLSNEKDLLHTLNLQNQSAEAIADACHAAKGLKQRLGAMEIYERMQVYESIIARIVIASDAITIWFEPKGLSNQLQTTLDPESELKFEKQMTIRRRGQELKLVIGGLEHKATNINQPLLKLIAKAHQLRVELESNEATSIKAFAQDNQLDHADAKNLIPLSYLAPSIIEDILEGHQPSDLTVTKLKQLAPRLPLIWSEQRQLLGYPA